MEFVKSWKFLAVVVSVIFAAAIVLLVIGISSHDEAGLIANVPQWEPAHFPLPVCVDDADSGDMEVNRRLIRSVAEETNARLGFAAVEHSPAPCRVRVAFGVPFEAGVWEAPGGHSAIQHVAGRAQACQVQISNVPNGLLHLVLKHELGHCLGLAHDDFAASIMRDPVRFPMRQPAPREFPPDFTSHDRDLLRRLYAAGD
jgi:hypothetical protein